MIPVSGRAPCWSLCWNSNITITALAVTSKDPKHCSCSHFKILKYDHITPALKKRHWLPVEYRINSVQDHADGLQINQGTCSILHLRFVDTVLSHTVPEVYEFLFIYCAKNSPLYFRRPQLFQSCTFYVEWITGQYKTRRLCTCVSAKTQTVHV